MRWGEGEGEGEVRRGRGRGEVMWMVEWGEGEF